MQIFGGGFKYSWNVHGCSPLLFGEDEPIFDPHIFQNGWEKTPPTMTPPRSHASTELVVTGPFRCNSMLVASRGHPGRIGFVRK